MNILRATLILSCAVLLSGCLDANEVKVPAAEMNTGSEPAVPVAIQSVLLLEYDEEQGSHRAQNSIGGTDFSIISSLPTPERVSAVQKTGIRTDGYSSWVSGSLSLPRTSELTVQTWVALENYPADEEVPYEQLTTSALLHQATETRGFSFDINAFGQWSFRVAIDGSIYTVTAPDTFPLYSWAHISAVVDGVNGVVHLYLNGVNVASSHSIPAGKAIDIANTDFTVGKGYMDKSLGIFPLVNGINGIFDNTEVLIGALSSSAINTQYKTQLADISQNADIALQVPDSRFINDLQRPIYHAMPPSAWTNEPHGLVEFNNQYHLFYQRTPNGPFKTLMHWGHMASPDFVNWSHLRNALWPEIDRGTTQGSDMKGIWSGDVVVEGDTAYAFYTSVNHAGPFNPGISVATSSADNLQEWTKLGPVIDRTGADDMRDPYLWKEGDNWHMIIGAIKAGRGYLLHYSTQNISEPSSWVRSEFISTDNFALMGPDNTLWEMPIFEKISDNKYVLLVNPVGGDYRPRGIYWIGNWTNGQFVPDSTEAKFLDVLKGHISPALTRNARGQITSIGIVDERRSSDAQLEAGWTHTFSVPRVWELSNDSTTIIQKPTPELASLRIEGSLSTQNNLIVNGETPLYARGRHVEIIAQLDANDSASKYGLVIGASDDGHEKTVIYYDSESKNIVLDKRKSSLSQDAHELTEQVGAYDEAIWGKPYKFHVYIDGSVVDVFINDKAAFSFRIYPTMQDSQGIALYSEAADTHFTEVDVYQMRDMQSKRTYIGAAADADGIVEENENGEIITVTVTNNTWVEHLDITQWSISGAPQNVNIGSLQRIDDTHVEVTLAGNSLTDFDLDLNRLILSVEANQFTKRQLPNVVKSQAPVIKAEIEVVTQATLTVVENTENHVFEGLEAGKQIKVVLSNNTFKYPLNKANWTSNNLPTGLDFTLNRVSDTEVIIELIGVAENYLNQDRVVTFYIAAEAFTNIDHELSGQPAMSTSVRFVANKVYNVTLASDGRDNSLVIGRFDGAQTTLKEGWIGSGDFANPETESSWQGTTINSASAQIGDRSVSTCEMNSNDKGCDGAVGSLTSPLFTIKENYFYWLMAGGNGSASVGVRLIDSIGNLLFSYRPDSCNPSFIDGDDDWTVLDVSALKGANVRVQFFDEDVGSCGFVSFDHLYLSARDPQSLDGQLPLPLLHAGTLNMATMQMQNLTYNTRLPYGDSDNKVIGRFDDANQMLSEGWQASGDFVTPSEADSWQGTARNSNANVARIGEGALSTCELNHNSSGCNAPMGSLTSMDVTVSAEQPILSFIMAGGNGIVPVGLRILSAIDDSILQTYIPNSCGPSFIDGDDDWVSIDLSPYVGQVIKIQVFDEDTGDCGFVSVDHIHFSSGETIDPSKVKFVENISDFSEVVADTTTTNVSVSEDAFEQVIGSFDDAQQTLSMGWQATGVFAAPTEAKSWSGTTKNSNILASRVGTGAVSTCEINNNVDGCDTPIGTLLSPVFKVDATRPHLNFLMSGGNGNSNIGLKVLNASSGGLVASFTPNSCSPSYIDGDDDWHSIDLSAISGQYVQIEIFDNDSNSCGFLSFDHLNMSFSAQ